MGLDLDYKPRSSRLAFQDHTFQYPIARVYQQRHNVLEPTTYSTSQWLYSSQDCEGY